MLVCDLVILELVRLAPNRTRATEVAERLSLLGAVPMDEMAWGRTREVQIGLAACGDHRRVPPADLLIAASAERAGVPLVHYDRDYERIATVTGQEQRWFVPDGTLA